MLFLSTQIFLLLVPLQTQQIHPIGKKHQLFEIHYQTTKQYDKLCKKSNKKHFPEQIRIWFQNFLCCSAPPPQTKSSEIENFYQKLFLIAFFIAFFTNEGLTLNQKKKTLKRDITENQT